MRRLGWILGGLFLLDGLVALIGGKRSVKWADSKISKRLPRMVGKALHEATRADKRVIKAWGINQIIAGIGMTMAAMSSARAMAREMLIVEQCPQPNPQEREVATA